MTNNRSEVDKSTAFCFFSPWKWFIRPIRWVLYGLGWPTRELSEWIHIQWGLSCDSKRSYASCSSRNSLSLQYFFNIYWSSVLVHGRFKKPSRSAVHYHANSVSRTIGGLVTPRQSAPVCELPFKSKREMSWMKNAFLFIRYCNVNQMQEAGCRVMGSIHLARHAAGCIYLCKPGRCICTGLI